MAYKAQYSGLGKTGICICGHHWEDHHLSMVVKQEYTDITGEDYIARECEYYGCNEAGGMMFDEGSGTWVEHCGGYRDSGEKK